MAIFPEPEDYQKSDYSLLLNGLKEGVKDLSPAYFAMVMATGIISIAAHLLGMPIVAVALFWLNIVTYLVLWFLNVLRVIWFTSQFFSDMVDHKRGPGFFTSIAGSCVLGSQFVLISGNYLAATFLWKREGRILNIK